MLKPSFSFLILILLFLSCAEEKKSDQTDNDNIIENPEYGEFQDAENPPVQFNMVSSTDLSFEDDLIVGSISAFTVDDQGNMYLVDSRQGKMVSLDPNGKLRFVTGQKGRGPGDFENVYSMRYHNDIIYLTNLSGARIDAFDLQGNFISSVSLSKDINFGSIKGITDNGEFILRSVVWGQLSDDILTTKLGDDSVQISKEFRLNFAKEFEVNPSVSSSSEIIVHDQKVIAGHLTDYIINIHELDGELISSIRRDFDQIKPPGIAESNGGVMITGMGGLDPIGVLSNGFILTKVQWPTNISDPADYAKKRMNGVDVENPIYSNSLDIFDGSGNLLYSFETEGAATIIGNILYVDNNDFIYSTTEDGSALQKFKADFQSDGR